MLGRALKQDTDQRALAEAFGIAGWLTGVDEETGQLSVDFPGNGAGPIPAQSLVVFDAETARRAIAERAPVLLILDAHEPARAFVLGRLQPRAVLPAAPSQEPVELSSELPSDRLAEARLDGQSVVLEGKQQVVLRCGEACIELRSDGRIVIRGLHVVTHAEGVNRIRGGAVQIN